MKERYLKMKILMVAYIFIWCFVLFLTCIHQNDIDGEGGFKTNNYLLLWLVMAFFIPTVAKIADLI